MMRIQAWIEMRQQWGLTGDQIVKACGRAVRTLLADARKERLVPTANQTRTY